MGNGVKREKGNISMIKKHMYDLGTDKVLLDSSD